MPRASTSPVRQSHRPDRLRRAWALVKSGRVERLGGTQFRVAGNVEETYDVDLSVDPACYCLDRYHRNTPCKHELAARLASLTDTALLATLTDMIEFTEEEA